MKKRNMIAAGRAGGRVAVDGRRRRRQAGSGGGGNDGEVIRRGSCSGQTDWKVKVKPDDGGLELEFEVDPNVNGQRWNVRIKQNGARIFQGVRTTQGPSGSFEIERHPNDQAGTDRFVARATNASTGETCVGRVSI